MSATITSLIRTWVPVVVGSFVAWLVTLGVTLDPSAQTGLTVGLTGLLIAAYYTVIRLLERKWPFLGVLLGSASAPSYGDTVPAADVVASVNPDGHLITGAASTLPTGDLIQLGRPVRDLIDPSV